MKSDLALVEQIRDVSRKMARAWGFMGGSFAGTELSPSSVHALMEIDRGGVTARELGDLLHLEKSSVSRMLRKLVDSGDVAEESRREDGRLKVLALTDVGKRRVAAIHSVARAQVARALEQLMPGQSQEVLKGLTLYSEALAGKSAPATEVPGVEIVRGYQLGLISRITQMHALFYARESGFGQRFESVVAAGLAEFCNRLENPKNGIWTALHGGEVVASVALDGEDLGPGIAHLRWFIVGDGLRGTGVGRILLTASLALADSQEFDETHLWTFSGLTAARHLYESQGFTLVEERPGAQWGKEVLEQRFVRLRP
jgi:DNA-binding MarR family transcriptional regulator/N-acetylglutamate synthase-like GNAT family acetyltransferase